MFDVLVLHQYFQVIFNNFINQIETFVSTLYKTKIQLMI
jgi:hypothetical protein